jgi:PAS domain S-box-containing protein
VLVLEPDFTIVAANDALLQATKVRREDILGKSLFDVFPDNPHDPTANGETNVRLSLQRVLATGRPDKMAAQRYDVRDHGGERDGYAVRYWSVVNYPVLDASGRVTHLVHQSEDITELVRLREHEARRTAELSEANSRLQAVYDQGLFAGRLDLDGTVADVNRSALELCGLTREDVIGKPFWECAWWNRSPEVQAWVKQAVEQAIGGTPFRGESTYFRADGTERVVDFACTPIKDEAARVLFVVPLGMDVTERVRSEKNLRATEILESITEGFFALDRDWRFTYMNQEAQQILGRTANGLLSEVIWEAFPGLAGSEFERAYHRAMVEREGSSITSYYPDHDRWYEVNTYPAPDGISIYFRNITEQKRAASERERLVAESEKQRRIYEAALSNTPDLVYVFDLSHRFIYANEALLAMWGRTPEDALGKDCLELGYEPWHAEMHGREIDQVVATRLPIRGEVPFTGTSGRRIYEYIFVPVVGPDGGVVAVAGSTRDVTDRQQAEQEIREQAERLREADRVKDEFLATLSHELRNPLAPLRNSLHLLRVADDGKKSRDASTARIHEMMERQVNLLVRLVDDLLEISRINRGTFALRKERVEVTTIVRNAVETSEPLIQAGRHRLSVSLPEEPLWLEGDPVRLAQILANLLNNAAKYTDEGGKISVHARRRDDAVIVSVLDNGVGIAADALPRMFEMFSRGDRSSGRSQDGLGIGLALSRRLAQMHGGTIDAHSEGPGKGSEFTVRLPLATDQSREALASASTGTAMSQTRILVVDDNRDSADSLSMVLTFLGADVRVARDGPEALAAFPSYDPAVVLLDIGMPGMDGYEVARVLRARFPHRNTAIVALTGWGQEEDRRRAREAGIDHHLLKPTEIGALQALLASLERGREDSASGG